MTEEIKQFITWSADTFGAMFFWWILFCILMVASLPYILYSASLRVLEMLPAVYELYKSLTKRK